MNSLKIKEREPSLFAQMVDALRDKSEAELKILYARFFQKELKEKWTVITEDSSFENVSEEDIIKTIQNNRYHK